MPDDIPESPPAVIVPEREMSLVFGKTGMGKSNYLKTYLSQLKRVIILDPLGEYPGLEFDDVRDMIQYLESINAKNVKNSFCVKSCNVLDLEALGEIVADGDKRDDPDAMREVAFLIEEAQRCLPSSSQIIPDSLKRIIFQGRHHKRSLIIAAQRPSIVNIAARSQWNRIVAFNFTEDADVKWIESASGYHVEDENDIRKFPVGDYLEITPGSIERKHAPLYIPRRGKGEEEKTGLEAFFTSFNLQTN